MIGGAHCVGSKVINKIMNDANTLFTKKRIKHRYRILNRPTIANCSDIYKYCFIRTLKSSIAKLGHHYNHNNTNDGYNPGVANYLKTT